MAYIKLNIDNFFHNLEQFTLKCGTKENLAIVLKDNAYGHGLIPIASYAKEFGIKEAVVRSYDEALAIFELFEHILVLNAPQPLPVNVTSISFAINSLEHLKQVTQNSIIELKVDTGMHRNGIAMSQLDEALAIIQTNNLSLKGVMTHFRSADELSSELFWQQKNFEVVKQKVKNAGLKEVRFHSQNSASTLRCGGVGEDLVRIGIGAYGYSHLPSVYNEDNLKPVLSLWARKTSSRELKKSQRVGYGGEFIAPKDMIVSTYDVGYGDGFRRGNASKPFILANKNPILGRVSMDLIAVEGVDEEICIFDDAHAGAKQLHTISYELTTQLSDKIERTVVKK